MEPRIYLDNAATSWPKPESVYAAVDHYMRHIGAAAGRGGYAEAVEAGRLVDQARRAVARLLGISQPDSIAFALNGTDALNTVLHGWLRSGDHAITTQAEHNSVLRPLAELERHAQVAVTTVPCDGCGRVDPEQIESAMRPNTRLVAVTHASNVTGILQPIPEIIERAHRRGVPVLVDAAQTAGYIPIDVEQWEADFVALPGHKGLLGPLGTGVLYIHPQHVAEMQSFRQGGTGTRSERRWQPEEVPSKFEAGNLNVAGIVGLGAGVTWLLEQGVAPSRQRALEQMQKCFHLLDQVEGLRRVGPERAEEGVAVVSVVGDSLDVHELAAMLDSARSIQVRAGLHCAPLIHQALDTPDGTLRASFGHFTVDEEVHQFADALAEVVASLA